jgi:hypothetical protein
MTPDVAERVSPLESIRDAYRQQAAAYLHHCQSLTGTMICAADGLRPAIALGTKGSGGATKAMVRQASKTGLSHH